MLSLSDNNSAGVVEKFYSISRYLDELFDIHNSFFFCTNDKSDISH